MSDKERTPVSGGGADQGAPDGVADAPDVGGSDNGTGVHGRTEGGESGGGGYPNPQTGKTSDNSGFMGHGGQTDIGYHGGGQAGDGGNAPNAATGSTRSEGEEGDTPAPPHPDRPTRNVQAAGQSFQVLETDGIATAEASGKVGTDAAYEQEQKSPGSG